MNCPTCGAENEADAHFCAECGTPLENQDIEATIIGQMFVEDDSDMTIMSTPDQLAAEQAKTVSVDHSKVADMLEQEDVGSEPPPGMVTEPPPTSSPPPPPPVSVPPAADDGNGDEPVGGEVANDDDKGGSNKTMMIAGIIVAVLLLCCCCFSFGVGVFAALEDPDMLKDFISFMPNYLPFV